MAIPEQIANSLQNVNDDAKTDSLDDGRDRLDRAGKITTVVRMSQPTLTVPATQANRDFSRLLRAARNGARITITSHGEPVAELCPVSDQTAVGGQRVVDAHDRLMEHLYSMTPVVVGPWTRDELYERS